MSSAPSGLCFHGCGTGIFALVPVSWNTDIPMELYNEQEVSLGRTGAQGAPQLWHGCAASQKWVLEHFSDSPFKRQNLRLRSLGTELGSTTK